MNQSSDDGRTLQFTDPMLWEGAVGLHQPRACLWFNQRTGEHSAVFGGIIVGVYSVITGRGFVERA